MKEQGYGRGLTLLPIAALACLFLLVPSGAAAATVVNGGFESGNLNGWSVHRALEAGDWLGYSGTSELYSAKRGEAVEAPPQGTHAAIADEIDPDTMILSQDIALGAGLAHRLSLLLYYDSRVPFAVPSPDTLSVDGEALGGQANQQLRVDVMRPDAPLESVDPADVLLNVFQSNPGDPKKLAPARLSADLSAFAGQTVRLRVAVAAHEELLTVGIDDVSVASAPPGQLPPLGSKGSGSHGPGPHGSGPLLSFGKVKANPRNGTAILPVHVSGPGKLTAKSGKLLKRVSVKAAGAGTVKLLLKPTASARGTLELKQKLRAKVAVTFKPAGEAAKTATVPVVLRLKARSRHRR